MKIVQSTWVRFHHFDLAGELNRMGYLEKIFTSLPWWKVNKEAKELSISNDKISCNFYLQGIRFVASKFPFYSSKLDEELAILQTKLYSNWVARELPDCNTYIGISGSGLKAGKLAKSRGSGYIMDRGSTNIRHANDILNEEHLKWGLRWHPIHPWLMENEEAEAEEANIITVPSHFVKDTFINYGTNPAKIRVVPYGVSLKEFYQVGVPPINVFRLVFVGQVSIRKGFPYLLKAFKKFQHPNKELIVVGNVQKEIKDLIAKIGCKNVSFIGTVSRSKVKEYLSTAHALVLPSIEEGLALVQAQAMACGCPVIATPNTGAETLFTNNKEGLIIESRNVNALVEAFTKIADIPNLYKEMSEASIKKAISLGGWEEYAKNIVDVAREAQLISKKI